MNKAGHNSKKEKPNYDKGLDFNYLNSIIIRIKLIIVNMIIIA